MKALIVYESMFGNTHAVADCVAESLRATHDVDVSVVPVTHATDEMVARADVVIVGGPTHAHGLSGRRTRIAARGMADKDPRLMIEPDAVGRGLRDWFRHLGRHEGKVAFAFDTRAGAPAILTGRARKGISRRLRAHGFHVAATKSFIVDKTNRLVEGEAQRAHAWGSMISAIANVRPEEGSKISAA